VAPSTEEGVFTWMSASRKRRGAGIDSPPGPVSGEAVAETPVTAPVIAIWNASNSFFAAESDALVAALAGRATFGPIFSVESVTQTVAARTEGGASSRRVRRARMGERDGEPPAKREEFKGLPVLM